ncbi:MAG: hypothetical protein JWO76_2672, partial [Nocardioides sp.]|nr:hypothetical protein [Nocardioides sp.]
GTRPPAGEDSDTVLVGQVLAELTGLTDLVSAVGAKYPRLRGRMSDLRALHVAHREALGDEPGREVASGAALTGAEEAMALVRARERLAQNLLADSAVRAASGALARLLASMSAAVAQRLVAQSAPPDSGVSG